MEHSAPFEKLTKLDAAERQLRVAIRMFFERKDMIAIHTLAAASQGILQDLGRSKGSVSLFEQGAARIIPEKRKEVVRLFRLAQNFSKHADRDQNTELAFFFDATKFYLLDAASLFVSITGRQIPETAALTAFFLVKYPHFFNLDDMPELRGLRS
jgi:hypothetical protein